MPEDFVLEEKSSVILMDSLIVWRALIAIGSKDVDGTQPEEDADSQMTAVLTLVEMGGVSNSRNIKARLR